MTKNETIAEAAFISGAAWMLKQFEAAGVSSDKLDTKEGAGQEAFAEWWLSVRMLLNG